MSGLGGSPVFVVGASRSGTEVMRSSLNRHPRVHVAGETHYFDDLRVRLGAGATRPLDERGRRTCEDYFLPMAGRFYGQGGDPDQSPMPRQQLRDRAQQLGGSGDAYFEAYCRLHAVVHGGSEADRWGEKTPRHVFRIQEILGRYPTAHVIVMCRDPRAVVASYRDWHKRARKPANARRLKASYDPSVASMLWRATVEAATAARLRHGPDRVRLLRYEDLVERPEPTLRELCSWLGIDPQPSMLDVPVQNSTYSTYTRGAGFSTVATDRWRQRLDAREVAVVQHWCRASMERLGYEPRPGRLSPLAWLAMIARLLVAVPRAGFVNRRRMGRVSSYVLRRLRLVVAGILPTGAARRRRPGHAYPWRSNRSP